MVQRIENKAKTACGTHSADVALPRGLTWDLHADVAAGVDLPRGTVDPTLTGGQPSLTSGSGTRKGSVRGQKGSVPGLARYYRRFIKDFSKISSSLTKLTKKNTPFIWGKEQEKAFVTLRKKLCDAPILVLPEGTEDMVVYSDVSYSGLGCVLMQRGKGNWDDHLPLVEFAYNNSYHASIKMTPYEMLYHRKCQTPICWEEVGGKDLANTDVVLATTEKIETTRERLKAAQDRWKSYADNRRRSIKFNVGDFVMLKVSS
ncbi:putative reverse transcriptase domain-containing protein [Tanacetum coccineum]|uniref:Reverse transcriptase domain-containing protein n=1 Tax=Tanacetum coccineum TaxID=301880 RepID=A0ABQ5E0T0_9ASTR